MKRDELESLVRMHQAEIFRYLRYLGAERTLAEDLAQDVFVAAWRGRFRPETFDYAGQAAYLRGVARNLFFQHCRRKRRDADPLTHAQLEEAEEFWQREFLRGDDGFDYVEALRRCLDTLTDKKRHTVDLFYRDGKSRAEIADQLQMSEDGVKSALRRIRALLADCVELRLSQSMELHEQRS